ncbi:UDP-glucose 6-dehydrogenase [Olavius algarvensis spirochete endosymbiont]|uniref:UDP-glucose dehydrogenase family protein n=1 Tax=Olavius algarvensis spirochete endosymbiont TaxID=260710 RepID=UPI00052CB50F|nr:UDP-glucose/GDP-mannose dehydrogenase family protein [Olavius algarvensis spirochete endosymbiont]KGM38810.1 UDP-glucose 6-dehydrogenase [Alkalispirochaeta odontotermitis]CAD7842117.1 MAG: UDP-glucose 6-dehydrogenase (EC 1.1.1.22) [Olavius algarvensis spirochete endosymbiont]VDB00815.1 UDP-glucose 6-dehydrogenase [Olavius algarvensis spirochete endosymbiont]
MKNIAVIGTGYVGLVVAVGLADFGNRVTGVDIDDVKIAKLNEGKLPFHEPGLKDYLEANIESGRLSFTRDISSAIPKSSVVFLAVGTPPRRDGSANLEYLESSVDAIAEHARSYTLVVTKSTVPVGTNRALGKRIRARGAAAEIEIVSNPEFLREGRAIQDFFHPDRIVIGAESERAREILVDIYRALKLSEVPFLWCGIETAELIKYATNAFLATKITFINQMANLADKVGADIALIAKSMGMDGRIGEKFLHPGPGFGGSCFPKDIRALASTGDSFGVDMSLVKIVAAANEEQKARVVARLKVLLDARLNGLSIAVLGLAFKSNTDDVRESPALRVIADLLKEGILIRAHDPQAMDNFKILFPDISYCDSGIEAMKGADAVLILTEWNEYRSLDFSLMRKVMRGKVLLDTRNLLDPKRAREHGFIYRDNGRSTDSV